MREHGVQPDATVVAAAAPNNAAIRAPPATWSRTSFRNSGGVKQRDIGEEDRLSGREMVARGGRHHRPPRDRAASCRTALMAGGM